MKKFGTQRKDYIYEFPDYQLYVDPKTDECTVYSKKTYKFLNPKTNKNGYKQTTIYNIEKQPLTLNFARLIMMLSEPQEDYTNLEVDHINHNRLDDRRSNLRWISKEENLKNRREHKRPHCKVPILIIFDDGRRIIYNHKDKAKYNFPYITVYTLANAKEGKHYSHKHKMKCFYQYDNR